MSELYVNELVNSLVAGHASILVGAGMSKNADPANDSIKAAMPLWLDLIDGFCDKLSIEYRDRKYLNTLTIAQEIEDSYGRPFLDKMIIDGLKDDSYMPSDIHVNLMSLPWSDVFTTNYDTLLERACEKVTQRKYQIVRDQKDLLYSSGKPRLIKLHGSLPSNVPFIITEEDFRKYPNDHAPFVNTVQQSLLENSFYLVGFSGDDPNFLKWIGWIHDNLGIKNSPKIFLITHSQPSAAKVKNLTYKNIELIVLDKIDKYKNDSVSEEYRLFFKDLLDRVRDKSKIYGNWPEIKDALSKSNSIDEFYNKLKEIHQLYPGWIVAPYEKHSAISSLISEAYDRLFFLKDKNKEEKELDISYEYCWLHGIIGRPLFNDEASHLDKIAERYEKKIEDAKASDNSEVIKQLKNKEDKYHSILLSLFKAYRISGDEVKWNALFEKLNQFDKKRLLNTDDHNEFAYEDILHDIYNLNFDRIGTKVEHLICDQNQGIWALRKASLLALDGQYNSALDLLSDSLNVIRYNILQNPSAHNFRYLSIENCLVTLHNFIVHVVELHENKTATNYKPIENRDTYNNNDFIWYNENTHYAEILTDNFEFLQDTIITPGFDIGRENISTIIGRNNKELINAFEFLGFRELTGIPFRLSFITYKEGVLGAAKRLAFMNQLTPIVLAVLVDDNNLINEVCTRSFLASMSIEKIDNLCDQAVRALENSISNKNVHKNRWDKSIREFSVDIMPELLSRLFYKCSENKFNDYVRLIKCLYQYRPNESLSNLSRRLFKTIPLSILLESMHAFWNMPILNDNENQLNYYPECFVFIYNRLANLSNQNDLPGMYKQPMNMSLDARLADLIRMSTQPDYHKATIKRLTYISQLYELTNKQRKEISNLISDSFNFDSNGDPYIGDFPLSMVNRFIIEDNSEAYITTETRDTNWTENKFDAILHSLEGYSTNGVYSSYNQFLEEVLDFVNSNKLSKKQADDLANKLVPFAVKLEKWNEEGDAFFYNDSKSALCLVGQLMAASILSAKLCNDSSYTNEDIDKIFAILESNDIPRSLLEWCKNSDNREDNYLNSLFYGRNDYAREAAETLFTLVNNNFSISDNVMELLVNSIVTADNYRINSYLVAAEFLIRKNILKDEQCNKVVKSLMKYFRLTEISGDDNTVIVSNKMATRNILSLLAHRLYLKKQMLSDESINIIESLRTDLLNENEFADIRNCWDEFPGQPAEVR